MQPSYSAMDTSNYQALGKKKVAVSCSMASTADAGLLQDAGRRQRERKSKAWILRSRDKFMCIDKYIKCLLESKDIRPIVRSNIDEAIDDSDVTARILGGQSEMAESINVRFRSTHGDVGPFSFEESQSVSQLRDKLFSEWPKEGPLSKEIPTSSNEIRLILGGKFLEMSKQLRDYKKDMGEIKSDTLVTMHMIVRPATMSTKQQGSQSQQQEKSSNKCCVIS